MGRQHYKWTFWSAVLGRAATSGCCSSLDRLGFCGAGVSSSVSRRGAAPVVRKSARHQKISSPPTPLFAPLSHRRRRSGLLRAVTTTTTVDTEETTLKPPKPAEEAAEEDTCSDVASSILTAGADSRAHLASIVDDALSAEFGDIYRKGDPMVTFSTKFEWGDYQCNAALGLAKRAGKKPRDVAEALVSKLEKKTTTYQSTTEWCTFEIAGPGFVNARLSDAFLARTVEAMAKDENGRAATPSTTRPQTIVVDYSSPNIAKDMHVGHLRSTVIGDALGNALEHRGHAVIRQNHVGDWGTQFGMLVAYLEQLGLDDDDTEAKEYEIEDLVGFYRAAKKKFDDDDEFKETARRRVVDLQSGDEVALRKWARICEASRREFADIYERLRISKELEEFGESKYNPHLSAIVDTLIAKGLAKESEGALVAPASCDDNKNDVIIVRKSDGGFNYATTDLAAAEYRARRLRADRVLYVTDAGQSSHFRAIFNLAKRADLVPRSASLEHVPFGVVQGEDGKKFKTRAGDSVKLKELLDEARARALRDLEARRESDAEDGEVGSSSEHVNDAIREEEEEIEEDLEALAETIGIAAVKYADLSLNRESNYKFSFDKMLALTGNTAPYMLYSYARIAGIKRQCDKDGLGVFDDDNEDMARDVTFTQNEERDLARVLARLAPTLADLEADLRPNQLCDFLYDLASAFNRFYEHCPVRRAPTPAIAHTRATLCAATAAALKLGLDILGIPVVDRL